MSANSNNVDTQKERNVPSFLVARDPSIDRRYRPCPGPESQIRLFPGINETEADDVDSEIITIDEDGTITYSSSDDFDSDVNADYEFSSASTTSANDNGTDSAQILLRLRRVKMPSNIYNISSTAKNVLIVQPLAINDVSKVNNNNSNKNQMEKHFTFNQIFDANASQLNVFRESIDSKIYNEESFTIATYGTSGSGKTYTLLGNDENPGILQRSLVNIFTQYEANMYPTPDIKLVQGHVQILSDECWGKEQKISQTIIDSCPPLDADIKVMCDQIKMEHEFTAKKLCDVSVFIWISFVELYNELVFDLLAPQSGANNTIAPPSKTNLKIFANKEKIFVKGLTSVFVRNSIDAIKLLKQGLQRVNYHSTAVNVRSSRSHIIFFVDVLKYRKDMTISEISYKFCDLAGSERLDKTGNVGTRLKEAQRINVSLMVLGRCIDGANKKNATIKKDVVPYRESKLTMLLKSALLGTEKLMFFVNITPTEQFYEENLHVLGFAAEAKNLLYKQPESKKSSVRYSLLNKTISNCDKLIRENIQLRSQVKSLMAEHKKELEQQELELRRQLVKSFQQTLEESSMQFEKRLESEKYQLNSMWERKFASLKRQHKEEMEDLREEFEEEKAQKAEDAATNIKKRRTTFD